MQIREATRDDVPAIVALLADDDLGATREDASLPLSDDYWRAFEAIDQDPNNLLVVVEEAIGPTPEVTATLQLTFMPGLSLSGTWRCQIEAVRVAADRRGSGLGRRLVSWAIEEAQRRGCGLVQLTTNRSRADAERFYASLGFEATHHGMKRSLVDGQSETSPPVDVQQQSQSRP